MKTSETSDKILHELNFFTLMVTDITVIINKIIIICAAGPWAV